MGELTEKIQKQFAKKKMVAIHEENGLTIVTVSHADATAQVMLQGAQLIGFTPRGEKPVIWKSKDTFFEEGVSVRGGIPVIGPWFGDHTKNPADVKKNIIGDDVSAHGLLRSVSWSLESIEEGGDSVEIKLSHEFGSDDLWSKSFRADITYTITRQLEVNLTITNTAKEAVTYACALHTYFAISSPGTVELSSFDGIEYLDGLDDFKKKVWKGELPIDQERDYIFLNPPVSQSIIDHGWNRTITLDTLGSESLVLWNPWIEKAKRLSMFDDDEYKEMLCIETANIADDARKVAPGASHTCSVTISTQTQE